MTRIVIIKNTLIKQTVHTHFADNSVRRQIYQFLNILKIFPFRQQSNLPKSRFADKLYRFYNIDIVVLIRR